MNLSRCERVTNLKKLWIKTHSRNHLLFLATVHCIRSALAYDFSGINSLLFRFYYWRIYPSHLFLNLISLFLSLGLFLTFLDLLNLFHLLSFIRTIVAKCLYWLLFLVSVDFICYDSASKAYFVVFLFHITHSFLECLKSFNVSHCLSV